MIKEIYVKQGFAIINKKFEIRGPIKAPNFFIDNRETLFCK